MMCTVATLPPQPISRMANRSGPRRRRSAAGAASSRRRCLHGGTGVRGFERRCLRRLRLRETGLDAGGDGGGSAPPRRRKRSTASPPLRTALLRGEVEPLVVAEHEDRRPRGSASAQARRVVRREAALALARDRRQLGERALARDAADRADDRLVPRCRPAAPSSAPPPPSSARRRRLVRARRPPSSARRRRPRRSCSPARAPSPRRPRTRTRAARQAAARRARAGRGALVHLDVAVALAHLGRLEVVEAVRVDVRGEDEERARALRDRVRLGRGVGVGPRRERPRASHARTAARRARGEEPVAPRADDGVAAVRRRARSSRCSTCPRSPRTARARSPASGARRCRGTRARAPCTARMSATSAYTASPLSAEKPAPVHSSSTSASRIARAASAEFFTSRSSASASSRPAPTVRRPWRDPKVERLAQGGDGAGSDARKRGGSKACPGRDPETDGGVTSQKNRRWRFGNVSLPARFDCVDARSPRPPWSE